MPNRILREGILTSERVDLLNFEEELFYRRLMSVVDDFGRFEALPILLRSKCYPLKVDMVSNDDIDRWLISCVNAGLVNVYVVDNKKYLEMIDFKQQVRAKESKYPSFEQQANNNDEPMRSTCIADDKQVKSNEHLDGDVVVDDSNTSENFLPLQEDSSNNCLHQEVIDLYHKLLPSARRIRDWTPSRQKVLRARWRERTERQALNWWEEYFGYISKSDFLMGRVSSKDRDPFELSIDWVLKPANMVKIIEGAYENRSIT